MVRTGFEPIYTATSSPVRMSLRIIDSETPIMCAAVFHVNGERLKLWGRVDVCWVEHCVGFLSYVERLVTSQQGS